LRQKERKGITGGKAEEASDNWASKRSAVRRRPLKRRGREGRSKSGFPPRLAKGPSLSTQKREYPSGRTWWKPLLSGTLATRRGRTYALTPYYALAERRK